MRTKALYAALAVSVMLSAGALGFLQAPAGSVQAQAGGTDEDTRDADDLSREELLDGRITFEVADGGWGTLRFDVADLVDEEGNAHLAVASVPEEGAEPYQGAGVYVVPDDGEPLPPMTMWRAPGGEPAFDVIDIEVSENMSASAELMFVLGSNGGTTTYHVMLVEQLRAPARADPALSTYVEERVVTVITERPEIGIGADHRGVGGAAGTAKVAEDLRTRRVVEHGAIDLHLEDPTVAGVSVERQVRATASEPMDGSGIGGVLFHADGQAGSGTWSADVRLGGFEASEAGRDIQPARVGSAVPSLAAELLGIDQPLYYASVATDAGSADLDLQRTYTGTDRSFQVSWGWSTADPADLYGWQWEDLTLS